MDQYGSWGKILIVEDDVGLAEIYKTRLQLIGYICFVAHDGLEALALIEKERPSLVLLDLMLPKLAGIQVLHIMRETDWGKDIKVLVISNLNETEAPADLRQHRIEGYVVKANLSDDQIDQLVNSILKPAGQQTPTTKKPQAT
jgi:DNA-binding response OmpR family regulator